MRRIASEPPHWGCHGLTRATGAAATICFRGGRKTDLTGDSLDRLLIDARHHLAARTSLLSLRRPLAWTHAARRRARDRTRRRRRHSADQSVECALLQCAAG